MSDAPDQRQPVESPRPSRQQLVVPPRPSNWPVVIGGVASGLAGFALVFGFGIGRSRRPPAEPAAAVAEATVGRDGPGGLEPPPGVDAGLLPDSAADAIAHPGDATPSRWSTPQAALRSEDIGPPPSRFAAAEPEAFDRYAARTVSHDGEVATTAEPRPGASRFSSTDLPPPERFEAAGPSDAGEPHGPGEPEATMPAGSEVGETEAGRAADQDASRSPPTVPDEPRAQLPTEEAPPDLRGPQPEPVGMVPADAARDVEPEPATPSPAAGGDAASVPITSPAAVPPVPARMNSTIDGAIPLESSPVPPSSSANPFVAPTAAETPELPPPTAGLEPSAVQAPAPTAVPATLPFAAAPPLGPAREPAVPEPLFATRPGIPPADAAPPAAGAGITGQGVPGPLQLEGVQTPQLAVEKRGPKEIQVGKPVRYEILVRNVGSATAHEVVLRDAVPRGTSLIATTPPATPLADGPEPPAGDLAWALGVLPPGGEVRVLMEVMPEEEGELGSIASVSFRADATLRSRSTKPALSIDCPEPEAVRIGRDMQVTLAVSNPGSGTATGVVLEAFLPETVSHRAGGELEFDVGRLRPGESKTIDLLLGTRGPGLQPVRLVARADGGIEESLQVPLEVTAPTLELAIDMPARRFLQRPATCRIAMVNAGTASARSVELAAQLPSGMKFVRANNAGWHDERTNRVLWNLEELPPGETGTVEAVLMPVQPGLQRITAAARSSDGPAAQVAHQCNVEGLAALAFQVMDSEDPIEVDGVTEYVIRVSNDGTKAATGVRVAAMLLGDLEPVEVAGPGGHRVENLAVEFEPLAKLGPGEEAVYRLRARGHRAGDHRVQVQLVSEDHPTPITKEEITSVYDDR